MGQNPTVEGGKYLNTMSNICGLLLILVFGPTHLGASSLSPLQTLSDLRVRSRGCPLIPVVHRWMDKLLIPTYLKCIILVPLEGIINDSIVEKPEKNPKNAQNGTNSKATAPPLSAVRIR